MMIPPPPAESGLKIPILFGAILALVGANVYLYLQLDKTRLDIKNLRESFFTELTSVKETSSLSIQASRQNVNKLKDELDLARRQAAMATGQAKEDSARKIGDLESKIEREQKAVEQQLTGQITEVKQVASAATERIGEVGKEVGGVKTDVANTKSELEKTISGLKRTQGDLDVTSGLVATNGKELSALKALGERNYFEFKLGKTKQPQRVGDITMLLKKTDPKKNKFTFELTADDKKVEKKDKTINEPLQFVTSKARQPYEIVVNQVGKDLIVGYLATPKVQNARN
jgi:hypothetical protein